MITTNSAFGFARKLGLVCALALIPVTAFSGGSTQAPSIMRGNQHIIIGITLDEAAVRAALPAGLEPAEGMTGGLNVYTSQGSDTVAPYTRSYVWVDLAGHDSVTGSKGRFILWVADSGDTAAMEHLGYLGALGMTALSRDGKSMTGTTTVDGKDIMKVQIALGDDACGEAAGSLNYPSRLDGAGPMVLTQYVWSAEAVCGATPVSADFVVDGGHALSKFAPTSLNWAIFGDQLSIGRSPLFTIEAKAN
jgi:hypothetical protein